MAPVKAAPTDPVALAARLDEAGRARGFARTDFGSAGPHPLFALTRRRAGPRPRIYLSSGIHGDEPAPPLALLSLLEAGYFDDRATWFLCPLLNPRGLSLGTRENPEGIDLNRDYRNPVSGECRAHVRWLSGQPNFDLCVCLHEDWESRGFYLYELTPDSQGSLAEVMIRAAAPHCGVDRSPVIDGREARDGVIRPLVNPMEREKWPEAIYLVANHTRRSYTVETPSSQPIEARVSALAAALRAGLNRFLGA